MEIKRNMAVTADEWFEAEGGEAFTEDKVLIAGTELTIPKDAED